MPYENVPSGLVCIQDIKDRQRVIKQWGFEEIIVNNGKYCGKVLSMYPGWQSSKHYHPIKEETMLCVSGSGVVEIWGNIDEVPAFISLASKHGTSIHLPPGVAHRFSTPFGEPLVIIEFSTPHNDADVERLEVSCELPNIRQT